MNIREAFWTLSFSPYASIIEVPPLLALEGLLSVLQKWGHIKCFRFDNGRPFGDPKRESVSPLALHIIARGCQVIFNPPRTPTRNAKVERSQGTTARWGDAKSCANFQAFQQSLQYAVVAQRDKLPSRVCEGKTRAEYYPQLYQNPRPYDPKDFNVQRAYQYLAQGQWNRKVGTNGQVAVFGTTYQVGGQNRHKNVVIKLDVEDEKPFWSFYDEDNQLLARLEALNLIDRQYLTS